MKSTPDDLLTAAASDSALNKLCDEIIEKLQAGDSVDLASLALAHPEYAEQLRRLLPALKALVDMGVSSSQHRRQRGSHGSSTDLPPRVLGDYRILREIGRGGMGVVYEAEQRSLNRRVALKVLPMAAALDARQFQRFQLEAQAAACLHHNNIVPVFAVGTEGGVPFYAMQYIEGHSLAQVLSELRRAEGLAPAASEPHANPLDDLTTTALARSLIAGGTTRDRAGGPLAIAETVALSPQPAANARPSSASTPVSSIRPGTGSSTHTRSYVRNVARLGLQAAEALDHAHARGIIHRDIKPGNLLLDAEGRLWVADFGLAQIQGDHRLTFTGDILGTLRYMSPEQALGKRVVVDGRTDLYSLGVTLYELLTLRSARDGRDRAEILRQIATEEPTPLGKLNPAVPADLATIVHKAIASEPSERYATAKDLAEDLNRFLLDRPILAKPPSLLDRAAKWSRRHMAAVVAATAVLSLAVAGLAIGILLIGREQAETVRQRDEARRQREFARRAVDEMYTKVAEKWLGKTADLTALQREFLEKSLAYYQEFAAERQDDPRARLDAARARIRVANIQEAFGRFDQADTSLRQSIDELEELNARYPRDDECRDVLARSIAGLAIHHFWLQQYHEAEPLLMRAITIHEALVAHAPEIEGFRSRLSISLYYLGHLCEGMGRHAEAERALRRCRDLFEALHAEAPENAEYLARLSSVEDSLGGMLYRTGRKEESIRSRRHALALGEQALAMDPKDPDLRSSVAVNLCNLGITLGNSTQAIEMYRRSIDLMAELSEEFPEKLDYKDKVLQFQANLASVLSNLGKDDEVEAVARPALTAAEKLVEDFPQYPDFRYRLARTRGLLAGALWRTGKYVEAEVTLRRAIDLLERLVQEYPDTAVYRSGLAERYAIAAEWFITCPDVRFRDAAYALEIARRATEVSPGVQLGRKWLSATEYRNGHWDDAIQAAERCIELRNDKGWAFQWLVLALAHERRGDPHEARDWYAKVRAHTAGGNGWADTPRWLIDEGIVVFGDAPSQGDTDANPMGLPGSAGSPK